MGGGHPVTPASGLREVYDMALKRPLNNEGFTLIELMVAVLILTTLVIMSMLYYGDVRARTADAQALADGKNLLTVASSMFLQDEDVLFTTADPYTGPVGTLKSDGATPRIAAFAISENLRGRLVGQNTVGSGGGTLDFEIWNINGTDSASSVSGKKEYHFEIDEDNNVLEIPSY